MNNMTTTTAEFKTMLGLYTPVSILEEKIDRPRGKMSRDEFSSVILEAGLPSDQKKIIMLMTSVVPSGNRLPAKPRATTRSTEAIEFVFLSSCTFSHSKEVLKE